VYVGREKYIFKGSVRRTGKVDYRGRGCTGGGVVGVEWSTVWWKGRVGGKIGGWVGEF
jgi:hypothetical protein